MKSCVQSNFFLRLKSSHPELKDQQASSLPTELPVFLVCTKGICGEITHLLIIDGWMTCNFTSFQQYSSHIRKMGR